MLEHGMTRLDEQARWEFVQEVERYHRKIRRIEIVAPDGTAELARCASDEHMDRLARIFAKGEIRTRAALNQQRTERAAQSTLPRL